MDTSICSLNVRGLGNKLKRDQVFHWLKEQNKSIYLLQETHLIAQDKDRWETEWGYKSYFSGNKTNSEGVCILLNKSFTCDIIDYIDIIPGRLHALGIKVDDKHFKIVNIYGPNSDDISKFDKLHSYITVNEDSDFIIGGDFNTVLNTDMDKRNGLTDTHKKCRDAINNILDIHNMTDIWRIQHPDTKKYTWHSSHKPPIFCRLDYFLISNNLINSIKNSSIKPGYKTDHSFIALNIDFYKLPRGPGYFKFNNSLLLDMEYKNKIKNSISETVLLNNEANPNTLWEVIKGNIRNETIKYSTFKKRNELSTEKRLSKDIEDLEIQIQQTLDLTTAENLHAELNSKQNALTEIIDNRVNGSIIRAKAQYIESNEKNSKYFF